VKPTSVDAKAAKVTSDSEPEIVKKEIKTEPVVDIADSEDESSKIRERLFSTTNVKEKCDRCHKNFKNLLTLRYHQLHCDVSSKSTSSTNKNSVEKNILQIKKSSESPADKILKKLSEKVLKTDKKSVQTEESKPKVKQCGVKVKKISKGEMKKFEDDIEKKANPTPPKMKEKPNSSKLKKPAVKSSSISVKNLNKKKPTAAKKVASPGGGEGGGTRVRCDQCGKKYADSLALEYHKITFHVGEEETKLFSTSLYNEQMNFDKTVLKLNEHDAAYVISDSAKSPKLVKRKLSIEAENKPGKSDREASKQEKKKLPIAKVNDEKMKPKKVLEKNKETTATAKSFPKAKPKVEKLVSQPSSGYCICDKPEREDMLGCDFCDEWYHPECIGVDEKEALQLTKNQSWKCPKCIEEDFLRRRKKIMKTPVKSPVKTSVKSTKVEIAKSSSEKKKPVQVHPKKLLQKKYLSDQDSSSSDSDNSPPPKKRTPVKRPIKRKPRVSSSEESSDSDSSEDESDDDSGKIIRIPVATSQMATYYK